MHHDFGCLQALAGRPEHRGLELAFADHVLVGADQLLEQRQALLAAVADLHHQGEPDALDGSIGHTVKNLPSQPCSRGREKAVMSTARGW